MCVMIGYPFIFVLMAHGILKVYAMPLLDKATKPKDTKSGKKLLGMSCYIITFFHACVPLGYHIQVR